MLAKVQECGNSRGLRIARHVLEDLVSRIPEDYRGAEVDWGKSVGREAW